jgi:hypothetical protein
MEMVFRCEPCQEAPENTYGSGTLSRGKTVCERVSRGGLFFAAVILVGYRIAGRTSLRLNLCYHSPNNGSVESKSREASKQRQLL